jgi:hypothetical protein
VAQLAIAVDGAMRYMQQGGLYKGAREARGALMSWQRPFFFEHIASVVQQPLPLATADFFDPFFVLGAGQRKKK